MYNKPRYKFVEQKLGVTTDLSMTKFITIIVMNWVTLVMSDSDIN